MPTLVHIADERDAKKILNSGIKIGKGSNGVFFMPVVQEFYHSHQWLRELKRRGIRTFVAVYFKLDSDEVVWTGKYHEEHKKLSLGDAIKAFMNAEDKLGYEFLIERKIEAKEIAKIKALPQDIGWRYSPDSHTRILGCACPICIASGGINSRKKREKIEPIEKVPSYQELLLKLETEQDDFEKEMLLNSIKRKKRRSDPMVVWDMIDQENTSLLQSFAIVLSAYRHPNTNELLIKLCGHSDDEVKQYSAVSIIEINERTGLDILARLQHDPVIQAVINENKLLATTE